MSEHQLFNVFIGLAVVTVLATGGALVGWYYCLTTYREYMSDRAYAVMKYVVPPFVALSSAPVADVVLWFLTDEFPTIGVLGPTVGLLGAAIALVYVLIDVRGSFESAAGPRSPGGNGTDVDGTSTDEAETDRAPGESDGGESDGDDRSF